MNRHCNDDGAFYTTFPCPHCGLLILVLDSDIACTIFRHGVFTQTSQQVPPHTSREQCDIYAATPDLVYGCCRPFRFDGTSVAACDYV